ncbi:SDR family oxidoreductase [Clostridium sediminicola]|uniref:SDR family NAD(P)-dependent oxidoreductase n=1 Tax=Clostridium sediminicola TaxID=3114879 RepID=UPI0031F24FD8
MKNKYKKAIVTGGAGFIGSHIVEGLLQEGLEVISIDNYFSGKKENLAPFNKYNNFHEIECDVTDYEKLKTYFNGVDIVFHNAASKKTVCIRDPRRDLDINAKGTFNILELSRDFGVKKIVHASSGSVYGEAKYFPQNEEHPLNPTSYYGVSKLAGEKYARAFCDLYGLDVTILRYFHVYGPRQESSDLGGVVSIFGRRILQGLEPVIFGDGTQQRSFTYVKDIVEINKLVAMKEDTKGEAYNCASGINITIYELAYELKRLLNSEHIGIKYSDWVPGDIKVFDIDNSKIRKLGFEFSTPFDEGVKLTLEWLKNLY